MMSAATIPGDSPYLFEAPPTSPGRAFLARAFTHWCVLHWGYGDAEIAAALAGSPTIGAGMRIDVEGASRLIGEAFAVGGLRSWARPVGGGLPFALAADLWELDDFRPRFASSGLDPTVPFDAAAPITHWIFVQLDDFNAMVEASCANAWETGRPAEGGRPRSDAVTRTLDQPAAAPLPPVATTPERLLRLAEVVSRTGLSRSTIYARIRTGRFPRQAPVDGSVAAWRESDVNAYTTDPRGPF